MSCRCRSMASCSWLLCSWPCDSPWLGRSSVWGQKGVSRATYPDLHVSLLHGLQREERPTLGIGFLGLAIPAVVLFMIQGLVMDKHIRLQFKKYFVISCICSLHLPYDVLYVCTCMYVCTYTLMNGGPSGYWLCMYVCMYVYMY